LLKKKKKKKGYPCEGWLCRNCQKWKIFVARKYSFPHLSISALHACLPFTGVTVFFHWTQSLLPLLFLEWVVWFLWLPRIWLSNLQTEDIHTAQKCSNFKIFPHLLKWPLLWFCEYRAIWGHKMWCSGVKSLSHPSSFAAGAIKSKSDISTVFGCRMMCINTLSGVFGDKEKPSGDEALETCISPILPCSCCGSAAAGSGSKSWGSTKPSMCTDNAEPFRSLPPACIYLKLLRVFFCLFFNLVHWCTGSIWDGVNNLCRCRAVGWICDSNSADNALLFWLLLRSACTAPRQGLFISLSAHTFPSVNRLLLSRKLGENTAGRGGLSWP